MTPGSPGFGGRALDLVMLPEMYIWWLKLARKSFHWERPCLSNGSQSFIDDSLEKLSSCLCQDKFPQSLNQLLFVQLLSCVQVFVTPWTVACQASLSFTISGCLLKLMFIESVMPSNHLILCLPLFPPALHLSQHQGLFQWVDPSHQMAKVLDLQLQHQFFQWIFRLDFL